MYAGVLDTCVLYPSLQRDFLLSLAVEGAYRPLWSSAILDELHECEHEKLVIQHGFTPLRARRAADHLIETMRGAFDDAEVTDWERYLNTIVLPDEDDRHVVACAIAGRADAIVTGNLRHFPIEHMPHSVEVMAPHIFALHAVTLDPPRARRAIDGIIARSGSNGRPLRTFEGVLDLLESRYGMHQAVACLRD